MDNTPAEKAIAAAEAAPVSIPAIGSPWPGFMGSVYAGLAQGENGQPDYHLVLLADKPASRLTWGKAIEWASGLGASLPTRNESALLYAFLRDQFELGWHWTGTQYSSDDARNQNFSHGTQGYGNKKFEARARAVRRFSTSPLESFNGASAGGAGVQQ